MGSDLQIVDVGSNILQFKFTFEYQMKWVEKNGPWNFENNLLLLCRLSKGLSDENIAFTHSPFRVQNWVLPFELMSEDVDRDLGNSLGRYIEGDKWAAQLDQAKYMRIRVDLPIDKRFRRKGKIVNMEGETCWVSFKYERLPNLGYIYGRIGHDDKHCSENTEWQNTPRQYGDWMRAYSSTKVGLDKARGMSNKSRETGSEEQDRGNSQTMSKPIAKPGMESGDRSLSQKGNGESGNPDSMGGDGMLGDRSYGRPKDKEDGTDQF